MSSAVLWGQWGNASVDSTGTENEDGHGGVMLQKSLKKRESGAITSGDRHDNDDDNHIG